MYFVNERVSAPPWGKPMEGQHPYTCGNDPHPWVYGCGWCAGWGPGWAPDTWGLTWNSLVTAVLVALEEAWALAPLDVPAIELTLTTNPSTS